MKNIAIITARGGSKRIPGKNIKDFCGRPIIAYTIQAALQSHLFDEVMVSTDDDKIAEIAGEFGANVPFRRSAATSNDYATTAEVLREVLLEYLKGGQKFEWMCCLYPTAPFVTPKKLITSFQYLQEKRADALTPVVKFSYPPQRCFVIKDGYLQYKWPQYMNTRSQDLEAYYHDVGQYYFMRVQAFLDGSIKETIPFIVDEREMQDIDNLSDWDLAEIKYKLMVG